LGIEPLLFLSHLVIDLHHVGSEVHATILEVELEERNRLHRCCTVVTVGLVIVLQTKGSCKSTESLCLQEVKSCD